MSQRNEIGANRKEKIILEPLDFSSYLPVYLPVPEEGDGYGKPIFDTHDTTGSAKANDNILHALRGEISKYHL